MHNLKTTYTVIVKIFDLKMLCFLPCNGGDEQSSLAHRTAQGVSTFALTAKLGGLSALPSHTVEGQIRLFTGRPWQVQAFLLYMHIQT